MKRTDFTLDVYGYSDDPAYFDWCLGQAVQALLDDSNEEAAALLLACRLSWSWLHNRGDGTKGIAVTLNGPMAAIKHVTEWVTKYDDELMEPYQIQPTLENIKDVVGLVLGPDISIEKWGFQVEAGDLPANWREELLEIARKKGTTNQGRAISAEKRTIYQYANLNFRSQSEIRIAQAFDRQRVMYFANCTARVNRGGDRVNREPDFLVCHKGHWGILEVDGEPFHLPANAAQDHERDRLFEHHGVRFVQHYDAERCYQEPEQVVAEFIELLIKNG